MEDGPTSIFNTDTARDTSKDVSTRRATRLIERDIEAPDVFQVTEAGLWDGRPSLGGVWVAHPDVKEPERVLIRNTANDKFVIGALFRRERDNPGPRVQVSSDAAAALGMLAGAPSNLNVTALRREEVPTEPVASDEGAAAEALPASAAVEEKPLDPVASATKAIDRAEGKATAKPETAKAAAATAPDSAATEAMAATEEPKKKSGGFFANLFQRKQKTAEPAEIPESVPATAGAAPAVAATALPPATQASAPAPAPQPKRTAALAKPYLQIGIFSVEQNARNTATAMRQSGMIPTVREQSSQGKTFWRVLIGPATSSAEQAGLLKKVKASGFTDAYAVRN